MLLFSKVVLRRCIGFIVIVTPGFMLAACISTSSEPDIASTRVISPLPPTPTAAPVVLPASFNLEAGAGLYEVNCQVCHGETGQGDGPTAASIDCPMPDFTQRSEDITLVNWFNAVTNGTRNPPDPTCPMPFWRNRLNEQERWDVTAYVYSLAPGGADTIARAVAQVADNPDQTAEPDAGSQATTITPGTTVEPSASQPGLGTPEVTVDEAATPTSNAGLSDTDQTAEPGETTTTAEASSATTFTLHGRVINGTSGGTLPEALLLEASIYTIDANNSLQTVYSAQTAMNPDGSFEFVGVPLETGGLLVETEYAGVRQSSDLVLVPRDIQGDSHTFEFRVYETTDDPSQIVISRAESLVDAVTEEGASLVLQYYEYLNNGDRVFISANGTSAEIPFPAEAFDIRFVAGTEFETIERDGRTVYLSTSPIAPGSSNRVIVQSSYGLNYPGSMEIVQTFPYNVEQITIYVAQAHNLLLTSTQLVPAAPTTFNNGRYNGYTTTQTLLAGQPLRYRVYDDPNATSTPAETVRQSGSDGGSGSFLDDNATLIFGIGVLLIIAGGMYLAYDLQKTRILAQMQTKVVAAKSKDELLAAIAALDEAYNQGEISESVYLEQREQLKEALRPYFS